MMNENDDENYEKKTIYACIEVDFCFMFAVVKASENIMRRYFCLNTTIFWFSNQECFALVAPKVCLPATV